ncbi:threonine/serine dehydratase [Parasulfitobacter algicola]|uniref:Threonine/serine dehydratase n=1 Tax=Parasulfitobacter algicola TaxID=2614809 RepID=A0ABX2IV38_9RHOB|nr:threonine/serine dehydratase [Sulfitobacter algicola]NSX54058.1 threonine/serine dehydratase [Sulfitobacter algicola]
MTDWRTQIDAAADRIDAYIVRTPVLKLDAFDLGYPVEIKLEQMQHTGSFKARGAFNNLLTRDVPRVGIVAASGGNHGAAVAFAARTLGYKARIYVPEIAGPAKIALIERTGADLHVIPGTYANALEAAQHYEAETGAIQIHAYDAMETVVGQGTLAREWQAQGLEADTVIIAVGGGGLIGGALAWFGGVRRVIAVEPVQAATLHTALQHGPETAVEVSGVAANALGARQIGRIAYDLAQQHLTASMTVTDEAIIAAQRALWIHARQLTEPAGAVALAALTSGEYQPEPDEKVAILICGGNIAPDPLA